MILVLINERHKCKYSSYDLNTKSQQSVSSTFNLHVLVCIKSGSLFWSGKCCSSVLFLQPVGQRSVTYFALLLPRVHWTSVCRMSAAAYPPVGQDCPRSSGPGDGSPTSCWLAVF